MGPSHNSGWDIVLSIRPSSDFVHSLRQMSFCHSNTTTRVVFIDRLNLMKPTSVEEFFLLNCYGGILPGLMPDTLLLSEPQRKLGALLNLKLVLRLCWEVLIHCCWGSLHVDLSLIS